MACDLGSKSVSGTADEAGDDGGGSDDSTGGSSEPSNPTGGPGDGDDDDGATSQGPGDGGDGTEPGIPSCLETITEITDTSQMIPLGFTPEDIISLSNGWSVDFVWTTDNGGIDIVPEGTTTTLDIGLTYLGGAINYVDSEPNPDDWDEVADCQDRLEMEVEIIFATADGRFNETFVTTGEAYAADQFQIGEYFDPFEFVGSFSADEVTFPEGNGVVNQFAIFATFAPDVPPQGSLNIEIEQWFGDNPDEGFVGFGVIAGFPTFGE